jgi:hypothetical protein
MAVVFYALGYLVVIVCVCYLAHLIQIPESYIIGIAVIMLGIGVATAVEDARQRHLN